MAVSREFASAIRLLIAQTMSGLSAGASELARKANALYVGCDMFTQVLIRPEGTVGGCALDEHDFHFAEFCPKRLNTALLFGSQRIPDLNNLIPRRANNATTCELCGGKGKIPSMQNCWCHDCGGVGWTSDDCVF